MVGQDINNTIIFGDCRSMRELPDRSVHLVVTSPPYYNAPFDYPNLFKDYDEFLELMRSVAKELYRVLDKGRIACFVTQDVRVNKRLYPVPADIMRIMVEEGFTYRDRIIWRKPEGYIRISRRSGVLIQHPYPMYFYPDNVYEEILIMQKGSYTYPSNDNSNDNKLNSQIDIQEFNANKWYLNVWDITNVLPRKGRVEEGIAAFPAEIPYRLIKLFSYAGETVLDPFMGSGTTLKVAYELGRKAIGYEIDLDLLDIIKEKLGISQTRLLLQPTEEETKTTTVTTATTTAVAAVAAVKEVQFKIIIRNDAKHLRRWLQERVRRQRSVAQK